MLTNLSNISNMLQVTGSCRKEKLLSHRAEWDNSLDPEEKEKLSRLV